MKPLPLTDATRRMKAPELWDEAKEGPCGTLDIKDIDGFMISAWLPTADELNLMMLGHPILLHICGSSHPVVALSVSENQTVMVSE